MQVVLLENHLQAFFLRMNEELARIRRQQCLETIVIRYHLTDQPFTNKDLLNRLILPFNIFNTYFNFFVFFSHDFTFYLVFASKSKMVRYRVIPPARKRVAAHNPGNPQQAPLQAKALQSLQHVLGTTGVIAADPNLPAYRDRALVPPHHFA